MLQKKYISAFILILLLLPVNTSIFASEIKSTDLSNLTYKQEINIPIDTSSEQAKYQPIDIRITFSDQCYAKDETDHSVRVGCDIGSELLELESQIYDLDHTDENHICSCNIVFLIPPEATGEEKYYVFYDSKQTEPSNYEEHISIEDTHYFYEPIAGQKIDFDYYKITQDEEIVYGVVQKGELLGNPIAHTIARFKPGSKIVETYNIDQLGSFDLRYGIKNEPGYYGTTWAEEVTKTVLVQGNLMMRIRISGESPEGEIKTDNIYTYYYSPGNIKKIYVDCYHEILKDITIEDPEFYTGSYAGIVSVKARSATIEKMNVGEILPKINVYSEDEILREYDVPQNPESVKKEAILSTEADIDLGSKAWISLNNPSTGKTHALIMDKAEGIATEDDGAQVKAFVKQNLKLPGLEAETGNIFLMRNSYEKNLNQESKLKKGFTASYNVEFLSAESDGEETIDAESEIFQTLSRDSALTRETEEKTVEEIQRYNLETIVHLAPSVPLGSLLSAALGKNVSYIYAELYKENNFRCSGSVGRISLAGMDANFEGKKLIEIIKMGINLFDWKNISFFKKIVFPGLEPGQYLIKIFKENPLLKKERQFIGFSTVEIIENTKTHIYCAPQRTVNIKVLNQDEKPVENVVFKLEYEGEVISEAVSSENGECIINAPSKSSEKYVLKGFYNGFLVYEQEIKLGLLSSLIKQNVEFSIEQYDLTLNVKDTWGYTPSVDIQPVLTSENMLIPTTILSEKIDLGEYIFKDLTPGEYLLSTNYKSFKETNMVDVDSDKKIDMVFPAEFNLAVNVFDSYGQVLPGGKISIKRNEKQEQIDISNEGFADINVPPGNYELYVKSSDDEIVGKLNIQSRSDKTIEIITNEDSFIHTSALILALFLMIVSFYLAFIKKQKYNGLKIFVIALVLISMFTPWWSLNGEDEAIKTSTNILIFPQKIVTLTSSSEVISGEISQVPEEATMVLEILFIFLISTILLTLISIFTKRLKKTTKILSILVFIILLISLLLFYFTASQITELGVGSVIGSDNLEISIPGGLGSSFIECTWGFGLGFYLTLFVLVLLTFLQIFKKKLNNLIKLEN